MKIKKTKKNLQPENLKTRTKVNEKEKPAKTTAKKRPLPNDKILMKTKLAFALVFREATNGLRYWAGGWAWILFESRENSKPENYLKTARLPTCPVHALLVAV